MEQIKYIPLTAVLNNVFGAIPEQTLDPDTAIEWASHAMEDLLVRQLWMEDVKIMEVLNHSFCLPHGLKYIDQIFYREKITEADVIELSVFVGEDNVVGQQSSKWLQSEYFINNWLAMRRASSPFSRMVHCKNKVFPYTSCEHEYSPNKDGTVTTSMNEGWVAISYLSYPKNQNGDFLIPDYAPLLECIKDYVLWHYWELRMNLSEQNAGNLYILYKRNYWLGHAKVKGKLLLPSKDQMQNWQGQLLRLGQHTQSYFSGFGNLRMEENIDFDNIS